MPDTASIAAVLVPLVLLAFVAGIGGGFLLGLSFSKGPPDAVIEDYVRRSSGVVEHAAVYEPYPPMDSTMFDQPRAAFYRSPDGFLHDTPPKPFSEFDGPGQHASSQDAIRNSGMPLFSTRPGV